MNVCPLFLKRGGIFTDRFSGFNPFVVLIYYLSGLGIVLTINNPVFSVVCLVGAVLYLLRIKGRRLAKSARLFAPLVLFVSVFNMLFAHYGEDVLFRIKDTDFTLEALLYGFNQGLVLVAVIMWLDALSYSIDSERVLYIFRFAPKLALIFSMVLGFIPRFTKKLRDISDAQLALSGGKSPEGIKNKIMQSVSILSALITYSLESSIITASSMEARGYNQRAVRRGKYGFSVKDFILLAVVIILLFAIIFLKITSGMQFIFEPKIYFEGFSTSSVLCFALLELLPTIIDLWEDILWRLSASKM